jgi:hypothetical protein
LSAVNFYLVPNGEELVDEAPAHDHAKQERQRFVQLVPGERELA